MTDESIFRIRVGDQVIIIIAYGNMWRSFCIVKQSGPYEYNVICADPVEEWLGLKGFNVALNTKLHKKDWVIAHTQLVDGSVTSHQVANTSSKRVFHATQVV